MQTKLVISPVCRHGLELVRLVVIVDGRIVFKTVRWSEVAARTDLRRWAKQAA